MNDVCICHSYTEVAVGKEERAQRCLGSQFYCTAPKYCDTTSTFPKAAIQLIDRMAENEFSWDIDEDKTAYKSAPIDSFQLDQTI